MSDESLRSANERHYEQLNTEEKIIAVLGAVQEPVTKDFALELCGIDQKKMGEGDNILIESAFLSGGIEVTQDNLTPKYRLSVTEREKLASTVDMRSVHGQIADVLMKNLYKNING